MKIPNWATTLALLAAICLLATSALSNPWVGGAAGILRGGYLLMGDNVTKEELNNMTPAEIKALKQQKIEALWNMTPAEIQNLREQNRLALENMTLAELQKNSQNRYLRGHHKGGHRVSGYSGCFRFGVGPKFHSEQTGCSTGRFAGLHGSTWMLLVDNATRNNFQNMTLAQIDTLRQQKKQELENMTLAEIRDLRVKKWQEMQNTTLAEIKDQRKRMGGM
jgi:hypothetical protein